MRFRLTPFRSCQTKRPAWLPAAFMAAYLANALIAYLWTTIPGGLAVFWLDNGVLAAALLLLAPRQALTVAAFAFAVDLGCAHRLGGSSWDRAALVAGLDACEAWAAALLIRGVGGPGLDLTRVRRFGPVILCGVLPATLAAGTLGSLVNHFVYGERFWFQWINWALGDFLSMSIGLPLALTLARFGRFDRLRTQSAARSLAILGTLCLLALIPLAVPGRSLAFLLFPMFLVAAFQLTPPYAAAGVAFAAISAALLTIAGLGPFALTGLGSIFRMQTFLACMVFTLFLAQGTLAERARTQIRAAKAIGRASLARARAESALADLASSQGRFRLLADNASDVIIRFSPAGEVTYISPSVRAVYGFQPRELVGRSWVLLVHPDDLDRVRREMRAIMAPGGTEPTEPLEYRGLTRDGQLRWIEASPRLLRDPATDDLLEIHSISRDVTRRKLLEAELEARRREAEAASVAKSEFLANMSHEIRTPLNGVIATADLLARSKLPPQERRLVEIIRSSGESLNRLLSDVLDLARIESGRIELEIAPFHLGEMVRSVVALCALRAQEKGLRIEAEVAAETDRAFQGDEVRIRQIVTNLVSNAVKFTAQGQVRVVVSAPASGRVRIEVIDTGVGFDPAVRERLFDRFEQADGSITRRFGGTGLGLPISRQLAETMGGLLDCESIPGAGSRFWFEAPLAAAAALAEPEGAKPEREGELKGRVLVVDDHPTNRLVAELILKDFGFDVETAEDGAEALVALGAQDFDLVLMDMQMPVMDGLTAVRRLRAREAKHGARRTPVLMLTANALAEHAAQSEAAGADGHVAKPITTASLMTAILAVADGRAAPAQPVAAKQA